MSSIRNPKGPHHAEHEPGGVDAIVALDGSVITTGAVPVARGGTGVTTGLTVLNGSNVTSGTIPDAAHSANVAMRNQSNTYSSFANYQTNSPSIFFVDNAAPVDSKTFRIVNYQNSLQVWALNDAQSVNQGFSYFGRDGSFYVGKDVYEKGRTTPMGHWLDVAYSAGLFTADVGTFTVDAGDVFGLSYTLCGKMCIFAFFISNASVSGGANYLWISLPAGLTPAREHLCALNAYDTGPKAGAYVRAVAGSPKLYLGISGQLWAAATNNLSLNGTAIFSIQ